MKLFFEFDPQKAFSNRRKHGIRFTEAITVFSDRFAQTFPDELHGGDEERWITLGLSSAGKLLLPVSSGNWLQYSHHRGPESYGTGKVNL